MRRTEKQVYQNKEKRPAPKAVGSVQLAKKLCPAAGICGGCQYLGLTYEEQLSRKQSLVEQLLGSYSKVYPIKGMQQPFHYRNKVHAVFAKRKNGEIISGTYAEGTHDVVPVDRCLLEDERADAIIGTIRKLIKSFKIVPYNEDTGYGLLRHVLIRTARRTGQILVVLVLGSPILPSKNNFIKALLKEHPEITTIVMNINDKNTSMVLGEKERVLYGKGYIEDILCGCRFRISPQSFYQINSVQTEALYKKAMELAHLTGKERVIDAYCGIGTIGLVAARQAKKVIGVELNKDAVRDAVQNAKLNQPSHADTKTSGRIYAAGMPAGKSSNRAVRFYHQDAGQFMTEMAAAGEHADVVFMDPPRAGSDEAFLSSVLQLAPNRIVYISCNPRTQARDLNYLTVHGYRAEGIWPYDLFPFTNHVETIALLVKKR